MKTKRTWAALALAVSGFLLLPGASAQITNTVFTEDFSGSLDPNKVVADAPAFEGGKGTIAPQLINGTVEITGTVTEQWWAGAALRVVPTFKASVETNVVFSVDRVAELGSGTGHRSAVWIMDSTKTYYVFFAYNSENNWQYNRKIGESGDVPTGGGTAIAAFNAAGSAFLDNSQHEMKVVANGKTVKLYLDNTLGAEVKFPFSELVFEIGSYARANDDIADSVFDNIKVQTVGAGAFSATSATLIAGQTTTNIVVRIPPGVNKTSDVKIRVVSGDPTVAIPVGATGDTLTLTFPAGGGNEQVVGVKSLGPVGASTFTLANDLGMASANSLAVVVIEGAGVRLADEFTGSTVDASKWTRSDQGFETGLGDFAVAQTGGQLVLSGVLNGASYWGGVSLHSVKSFTATPDLPLSFEMDRVSIDPLSMDGVTPSTGARTGVLMANADRSTYIFFGQNVGETGWEVNVTATGSGTALTEFSSLTDYGSHHLQMVADGTYVKLYVDGKLGGTFDFPLSMGIFFDVAVYARDNNDAVKGVFDNVKIQNVFPAVAVTPDNVSTIVGVNDNAVTVTIPRFLNATADAQVTVVSADPSVATPEGAVNGSLTLNFPMGSESTKSFNLKALAAGITKLTFTSAQGATIANGVNVTVLPAPKVVFKDEFSGTAVDTAQWTLDATPLVEGGTLTADSSVYLTNSMVEMAVHCEAADWPGYSLFTKATYTASALSPVDFELDRVAMEYVQIGGNTTQERTGVWVKSGTNYVFFNFLDTHDGSANGWRYNLVRGTSGDSALPAAGTGMSAFGAPVFNVLGLHHLRVQVNGTDVKLYVDGVFGAAVPFAAVKDIVFGFGAYANYSNNAGNVVRGFFDNAVVTTYPEAVSLGSLTVAKQANGDVVIGWTGAGTLQSSTGLPGGWSDVSPAPTGKSFTVTAASAKGAQFFRLRQ